MKNADLRTTDARLTQSGRNQPFFRDADCRKSRLTQRLTQLTQNALKTPENSHWHGRCNARMCCAPTPPSGATELSSGGRAREACIAPATVWDASLTLRTQPSLGCSENAQEGSC